MDAESEVVFLRRMERLRLPVLRLAALWPGLRPQRRAWRHGLLWLCLGAMISAPLQARDSAPEAALKAAFVYNFTKFVSWPALDERTNFQLCTLGQAVVIDALQGFEGRQVAEKAIHVLRNPAPERLRDCQLLYVPEDWHPNLQASLLQDLQGTAVLTVGDGAHFIDSGGMIMLLREGGRLRFEINLGLAQARGLKVAAPLLRLARRVKE